LNKLEPLQRGLVETLQVGAWRSIQHLVRIGLRKTLACDCGHPLRDEEHMFTSCQLPQFKSIRDKHPKAVEAFARAPKLLKSNGIAILSDADLKYRKALCKVPLPNLQVDALPSRRTDVWGDGSAVPADDNFLRRASFGICVGPAPSQIVGSWPVSGSIQTAPLAELWGLLASSIVSSDVVYHGDCKYVIDEAQRRITAFPRAPWPPTPLMKYGRWWKRFDSILQTHKFEVDKVKAHLEDSDAVDAAHLKHIRCNRNADKAANDGHIRHVKFLSLQKTACSTTRRCGCDTCFASRNP